MRTAADFDTFYSVRDPWDVTNASFRDRVLRACVVPIVRKRRVLELGCGEGHLTENLFNEASAVTGVDISDVAIERAKARKLPNAKFLTCDFLKTSFEGYDVVAAIECIYYLSTDEQEAFFAKVAREHRGRTLILSGPIIGKGQHRQYFTHVGLMAVIARHGMFVTEQHNLVVNRRGLFTTVAAVVVRIAPFLLGWLPSGAVFQRCYIIRTM